MPHPSDKVHDREALSAADPEPPTDNAPASAKPGLVRYDYLNDSKLSKALAYWNGKRGTRRMPQRADIVPGEIKEILPSIMLTDALADGMRFRCRLVGTAIVSAFGADLTGKYVGEYAGSADSTGPDEFTRRLYQTAWKERLPVFSRGKYIASRESSLTVNRLLLPLSEDGERPNIIMAVLTFEYEGSEQATLGFGVEIDPSVSYIEVIEDIEGLFPDPEKAAGDSA
ncbi:MAG: PAS domain-containing protein [Parvibaculum sp.]|nr:PAS domain-containing protein [Parvibaculum sp.]